ncbi:MAG: sugar ABC transporter ATP-binding protein [Spirochaetia bacterium]|nr:sugar ABC transporter ATP-binding protein [Spirochaetia bacterium]
MSNLIEFEKITKLYPGVKALDAVDFSLKKGEIHCLVGENGSGKSTMIKIISGVEKPEIGARMMLEGQDISGTTAKQVIDLGIRVIYQDLALFPNLTVKENIAFGIYGENSRPFVDWKKVEERALEAMSHIGLEIDLERKVKTLSIAEQQQTEIARSLIGNLKLLILDEPTASLTRTEVDRLFKTIKTLQGKGIATLFVSHKLNEIFEIAESVTVFRDGNKIGVYEPKVLDHQKLIYLMTGQKFDVDPPKPLPEDAPCLMKVENLSREGNYKNISFTLKKGEILGIIGRLGSGRTEMALSLFGMNPSEQGNIYLEDKEITIRSHNDATKVGIAYVPEDRLSQGLVMPQAILSNLTVTILNTLLNKFGLLDRKKEKTIAEKWVKELSIKIPNLEAAVQTLSGGNQQKVVLSKWLATDPKVLILDEPTIGIDVYAKNSVHRYLKQLAEKGIGIILISDEVHEVLSNCHRVLVMDRGRICDEITPGPNAEHELLERFNLE